MLGLFQQMQQPNIPAPVLAGQSGSTPPWVREERRSQWLLDLASGAAAAAAAVVALRPEESPEPVRVSCPRRTGRIRRRCSVDG